ncbi:N-acyl homoserine lactonase family protein [Rhizobium sp. 0TCS1.26]|uniref:N-acyl homoserine lactonase family protein n=1 Tax=Rhizobium sp. 0TCS1.26 TaxID=3142623 RepID=UPI003D29731A
MSKIDLRTGMGCETKTKDEQPDSNCHPAKTMEQNMCPRLYAMTCGWLTMPYRLFLSGSAGWLVIPVPSYLIVHPKGTALFDTGLETGLQSLDPEEVKRTLGKFEPLVKPEYKAGEDVAERLKAFGVDPEKIDFLINSHLHFDHCGGNELIKNARLVLQKREWIAATTPETIEENSYLTRQYDLGHDKLLVDGEHDLFGDGSVILIPTHGHTPGHQSLKVKLQDGEIILSADACYLRQALEKMVLPEPAFVRDETAMLECFRRLQKYQNYGVLLVFGHDPEQWKQLNSGPMRELTYATVAAAARGA